MYQMIAYIKFLSNSTNQHGVHSPFIYDFVTKCLYDKSPHSVYDKLLDYRQLLKSSGFKLKITDHGEGSRFLDSKQRAVSKMVRTSSSSKKEAKLLYRVAQYFNFKSILELGTSLGVGTLAFALSNVETKITTIEGCPNTSDFAKSQLKKKGVENVLFKKSDFKTAISNIKEEQLDCIYFDGHHNREATISYFESLLANAHNSSVFIFDDIYWSKGMSEAWAYIKQHHSVTVTVDCFHLGFVFFRKEQAKEHFKIRL